MKKRNRSCKRAFTLVEVLISIAILGTMLIAVFGLLGVALSNSTSEASETGAGFILSTITSDIRSTSATATNTTLYTITMPVAGAATSTNPNKFYLDTDYNITTSIPNARYQVNYWTTGSTTTSQESLVRVIISWPAGAQYTSPQGSVETVIAFDRTQ